ncbi:MAG: ribosome silencing factor [Planctomycetota bacterium]|nr:ribosome silencing factor [Planctomycetota bacterium]
MNRQEKSDLDRRRLFASTLARLAADSKCSDIVVLEMVGLSQVCDFFVIASGTSSRQMRSVADAMDELGEGQGFPRWRLSRDGGSSWILADFVHIVVHLFEPGQRSYYDIEGLWGDARRVDWSSLAPARKPVANS